MRNFIKKTVSLLLASVILLYANSLACLDCKVFASSEIGGISAKAFVLVDKAGQIIFERDALKRLPMASTTKIMTAMIVSEHLSRDDKIKIPRAAVGIEGSSAYLKEGETLTVNDLVCALLLQSANDAAVALALAVSSNVGDFCALMNQKAEDLGLKNTHFDNPHGLDSKNHYTSARDLSRIMLAALDDPWISEIMATKKYSCISDAKMQRVFVNHNKLLSLWEYCIGGKTGYTKADGRCLVSASEKNGVRLVAVTLSAPNDWDDHQKLYKAGFELYEEQKLCGAYRLSCKAKVSGAGADHVVISNPLTVYAFVRKDQKIEISFEINEESAPVSKGECCGFAVFSQGENVIARVELVSLEEIKIPEKAKDHGFFERLIEFFKNIF